MDEKFMTFAEAITFLRLSRPTIDRLIAKKEIPNYKIGRRRLFDRDELIEWVKKHRGDKPKNQPRQDLKRKEGVTHRQGGDQKK